MASGNNRFAFLQDEMDDQPGHGVEHTIESPVSTSHEIKRRKKKKKKAKQPKQIPSDDEKHITHTTTLNFAYLMSIVWDLLNYLFGVAFLRRDTARYCPYLLPFLSCSKPTSSTDRTTSVNMDRYCTL